MGKRIAIDLRIAFHEKRGIARYVTNLTRELLILKPKDIELLLLVPEHHLKNSPTLFPTELSNNVVALPETPIWHWEQLLLPRWCQQNKVDLLHMVTNRGPIMRRSFRETHVVHDTIGLHQKRWKKGILRAFLSTTYNRLTVPISARKADLIFTVSNFSKQLILKDLKVPEKKVRVIYNGVDERFFSPKVTQLEGFNLQEKSFMFHLGSNEPRKNTRRVIEAYSRINRDLRDQFPLVIAGLSKEAKEVFLPIIKELDLEHNTIILPIIEDDELVWLYASCSTFVWPSLWEGFGLPVLEAMATGTPVITSNSTSLPEVVGDAAYLVNPEKVEEISNAMTLLLTNQDLRETLSQKGRKRAQLFTWSKTAEETIEAWREILSF